MKDFEQISLFDLMRNNGSEDGRKPMLRQRVKVLSLYDGMSCGMIAMQKAGLDVERYVAYEIDKYAVETSKHNFPQIEHCGDVFKGDFLQYRDFDFLIGGSPCTYWSIAQKNNRETEASGIGWELFSQYFRALNEARPRFFIYENNKSMSKAIRNSIRETFGFEEICINSALVSAQNRNRYYWVGMRNANGTYSKVDVQQPDDLGIMLQDVLDGVATRDKGLCLCGNRGGMSIGHDIEESRHNLVAEPIRVGTYPNEAKNQDFDSKQYRIYGIRGKSTTLCGQGGGMGAKTGLYAVPVRIPEYSNELKARPVRMSYAFKGSGAGSLESECFPDNPSKQVSDYISEQVPAFATPIDWDERGIPTFAISGADGKKYPVYEAKSGKITVNEKQYDVKLEDGLWIIRKLTVSECKRLQTVPEWYEFPVSTTQAYKMLGNGWTCDVIAHLIRACMN